MIGKLEGPTVTDLANATERKRSKKRKYSKIDDLEKACDTAIVKQDKKSKGHKREAEVTVEDLKNGDGDGEKDKKRRKKIKDVAQTEVLEQSDLLKKKKQKNKTGFPDPNEDESLHDQSRKCLSYAFGQFHRPSKWKFNKACQNWLIRNFWSDKEVPEAYVPLVTAYFANVQGGARENLVKSCRATLEPPKIEVLSTEAPSSDTSPAIESKPPLDADNRKITRAQAVFDALVLFNESLT